jgi:DNA-binding XRE family transcriptional regulator
MKIKPLPNKLNKALIEIRLFNSLSVEKLSQKLEISQSSLWNIEYGVYVPGLGVLQRYSKAFRIPVSAIFILAECLESGEEKLSMPALRKVSEILESIRKRSQVASVLALYSEE